MLSDRKLLDPDRGQPYVQEWVLGYGHRLPWHTSVDVAVIRRAYKERTAYVDVNGLYEGTQFVGYRNPSANEIFNVTGNRWNWPVYTSIEVRATRQSGPLQLVAGYTRAFQHLAGTWQPNDPASFIQPNAFPNDAGIGSVVGSRTGGTHNSLTGFADFSGPQWRDHLVRIGVTYQAPGRFLVATTYSIQSGVWSSPIVTRIDAPDPGFGSPLVTLSNGRVVSNPLATTIRFAHPTRGEGQFSLPAIHTWNIRVGYDVPIPRLRRTEVMLDVFNVTNRRASQLLQFGGNQLYNPGFGQSQNRQLPRSAALAIRVLF